MSTATFSFTKAVKGQGKLRLALDGPPGGGKTWTSLTIAAWLAEQDAKIGEGNGRVAMADSERDSGRKYAGDYDFDHLSLPDSNPHTYIAAIKAAAEANYSVLIIDSLSHAWEGTLDLKDQVVKRSKNNDGFGAWREVTPVHNELVDTILRFPGHVIVTMRTKMEHLVEKNEETGKSKVTKVGLRPIQRDGVEYEFDVVGDLDQENTLTITKSRCFDLSGQVIRKPDVAIAKTLWEWLRDGEPLVSEAQADELRSIFKAVPDEDERLKAQRTFVASFGKPAEVTTAQFAEALAFAREVTGVTPAADAGFGEPDDSDIAPGGEFDGPTPVGGAADPTNGTGADAPTPSSTDAKAAPGDGGESEPRGALLIRIEQTISGFPQARQDAARKAMAEQFGEPSTLSAEKLAEANEWLKAQPVAGEGRSAEEVIAQTEPAVPSRLSGKVRGLLAYARGKSLEAQHVVALNALLHETHEPRPIGEITDEDVDQIKSLIDSAAAGDVEFVSPNGVLIAKEKEPA